MYKSPEILGVAPSLTSTLESDRQKEQAFINFIATCHCRLAACSNTDTSAPLQEGEICWFALSSHKVLCLICSLLTASDQVHLEGLS